MSLDCEFLFGSKKAASQKRMADQKSLGVRKFCR